MKKASDTKLILQRNGKNFQDFRLFLPAGQPTRILEKEFIEEFNQALKSGVSNIDEVVEKYGKTGTITGEYSEKISY